MFSWPAVLAMSAVGTVSSESVEPAQPAGGEVAAPAGYSSVSYQEARWQKIVLELGADSPEIAILRVDPGGSATQLLIRNPRKMHVPLHWHSANETHTILRGTTVFECDGKRDVLGPGSFNYIPSKMAHQAWLPDDGLVFITVDAAWDINWVKGPPTAADVGVSPPDPTAGR